MPYQELKGEVTRLDLEFTVRKEQTRQLVKGRVAFLRRQAPWKLVSGGLVAGFLTGWIGPANPVSKLVSLTLGVWRLMPLASHWLGSSMVNEAGHERD